MEKKSKKSIIVGATLLLLITLILLGLTYAYYRTRIIGNPNYESISVTSKLLEITYHDGTAQANMTGNIEPGYEYTKEFSVENTWNETASYSIVFDNLTNEYTRSDWTYKLYSGISAVESNLIKSGNIITEVYDTKQTIIGKISLEPSDINEYYLVITYEDKPDNCRYGKKIWFKSKYR